MLLNPLYLTFCLESMRLSNSLTYYIFNFFTAPEIGKKPTPTIASEEEPTKEVPGVTAPITTPIGGKRPVKDAKAPGEEAGRGRGSPRARKTPSPGDADKKGLKPGGGRPPGEEAPFAGFQLKAVPLKFVKELKDIVLEEAESIGSSAVFECQISPSTAQTSWMKDGSTVRESPKHKFTSDGKDRKLHIIDVQLSDTGEYTCVGRLGKQEKMSTAKLIVQGILYSYLRYCMAQAKNTTGNSIKIAIGKGSLRKHMAFSQNNSKVNSKLFALLSLKGWSVQVNPDN
uniref:Ig-like domain-containing protein n=1 Tax=Callorhinchus milii TaxID=7868 RepID=A0A4W3JK26_CALMI